MWKPMLDFTAHVERRAGERQRRRRKRVKTPLNPRVRSVDLSGRLSQENTGVSQLCSVKWVSPQFVGYYTAQSQNSTEMHTTSPLAQPCNTRRLETKGKCTRKASKAPPAEMRMLFPPRTRPAKCRGRQTGAEQREGKLGRAGTHSRFPLDEIDENSAESLDNRPLLKCNASRFTIQTGGGRGVCSASLAKPTLAYATAVDPPKELPTASGIYCTTSSGRARRKEDQAAQKSKLYCKTDGSGEERETNRGVRTEQKSPGMHTQKGRRRVGLSPAPSNIEDLSSLMECTSISTTPQDRRQSENPSRNCAATAVAIVQQQTPLTKAQSSVFDITSFHPPTTSTPLRCRQLRLVDTSGSGDRCMGEQMRCDYDETVRGRECMSPIQLCLKEPMSKCRERGVVGDGGNDTVVNSQAIHKSHCEYKPVLLDQSKGRQLFRHSEMDHKASQTDSKPPLNDDSTTMMAYGEHDHASMSTCAYTSLHTPLRNSDICSPLSPAPILAPETPLEYWGMGMRCRTASALRECCAVNESSAVESVQDSYTTF